MILEAFHSNYTCRTDAKICAVAMPNLLIQVLHDVPDFLLCVISVLDAIMRPVDVHHQGWIQSSGLCHVNQPLVHLANARDLQVRSMSQLVSSECWHRQVRSHNLGCVSDICHVAYVETCAKCVAASTAAQVPSKTL